MEQGPASDSVPPPSPIDKTRVWDIKPLRCLVPVFPSAPGMSSVTDSQATPFVCSPPIGPFPPGVAPLYPFSVANGSYPPPRQYPTRVSNHQAGDDDFSGAIPSPVPLNAFRTPQSAAVNGRFKRGSGYRAPSGTVLEDDGYSDSQNQVDEYGDDDDESGGGKRRSRPRRARRSQRNDSSEVDVDNEARKLLTPFKLMELDEGRKSSGDRDVVEDLLLVYNMLRRKLEIKDSNHGGGARRPDLKAGTTLMKNLGIRTNTLKRVGNVPGVEIGDIFFFRMELCLVGLHSAIMAGIDYMSVRVTLDEEPIAVSIVSSGGYDDEGNDDDNVLIYSGSGGVQRRDGLMFDQKLERGNLAMEKSVHRGNEIRVIRGVRDILTQAGKVYVYDGLYRIQESWTERNQYGCSVFKYKLVRLPGQPPAYTIWKSVQQWRDAASSRAGVILPDLTSGSESQPVSLVNDVDDEKGPAYFTYIPGLKYAKPFPVHNPTSGCHCVGGCQPGDLNCSCIQMNGGLLPYSSMGVLMACKTLIHECGLACSCPPNCRNRMSQAGLRFRLEVFKTNNRGWGLRSWDPIRSGAFICEYAGEVVEASRLPELASDNEDGFLFDATRKYQSLELVADASGDATGVPFPLVISSKSHGNVARFMNHSCSPNALWQPVLCESNNDSYLHVAFFAIRHIPPLQEITFDYGMVPSDQAGFRKKKCLCASSKCRGFFY